MNKVHAEEDIKLIRQIMEQSARYTSFSGFSGIIAGTLALVGCAATYWITYNVGPSPDPMRNLREQFPWYVLTWLLVFIGAVSQDCYLAQRKARKHGQTIFSPPTYQVLRAILPGVAVAFVLSLRAVTLDQVDAVPAIWAMGYGVALCAAGLFTVREVKIFGIIQLITGAVGIFLFSTFAYSLYLLALSMGVYHIAFGLWMTRKYGW